MAEIALEFPEQRVVSPVWSVFCDGLYVRECHIAKGTKLTSAEHKFLHPFFVLKGRISVYWTDNSGEEFFQTYEAPCYALTQPGTKRFLVALEDTVWITVHRTDSIDPDRACAALTEPNSNPHLPAEFVPEFIHANHMEERLCQQAG
jgi:hypothetical protein